MKSRQSNGKDNNGHTRCDRCSRIVLLCHLPIREDRVVHIPSRRCWELSRKLQNLTQLLATIQAVRAADAFMQGEIQCNVTGFHHPLQGLHGRAFVPVHIGTEGGMGSTLSPNTLVALAVLSLQHHEQLFPTAFLSFPSGLRVVGSLLGGLIGGKLMQWYFPADDNYYYPPRTTSNTHMYHSYPSEQPQQQQQQRHRQS